MPIHIHPEGGNHEIISGLPQVDGHTLMPDVDYDFGDYYRCEIEVINPALEARGFKVVGNWYSPEFDSFGPLSRAVRISGGEGEVEVFYA